MIKTIRIQNFRSLQDVTLNLQDVNLLIGPNNSGKSNLLKAFKFLGEIYKQPFPYKKDQLQLFSYMKKLDDSTYSKRQPISFTFCDENGCFKVEVFGFDTYGKLILRQFYGNFSSNTKIENISLDNFEKLREHFQEFTLQVINRKFFIHDYKDVVDFLKIDRNDFIIESRSQHIADFVTKELLSIEEFMSHYFFSTKNNFSQFLLKGPVIYSIDISHLKQPYPTLEEDYSVKSDASNLVAFLDNMRDNQPQIMNAINSNLKDCIKEFDSISFEKVRLPKDHDLRKIHGDKTFKRLGVQDKFGHTYWADELSDGTLYFLALLAIIHQPDPPKLLMVEEPENGIHPRRVKEIIDYFFQIAEEKGIQVILTTHSTVVIDQFKDLPESIFVFDKKDQSTQVRNLLTDIIAEDKQKSKELHVPELDLSGSLGDHWAAGLIGGVPR